MAWSISVQYRSAVLDGSPAASSHTRGGLKQKVLGVSDELYESKGTVSPEMAVAMAAGARDLTGTDYAVSVTGVAGPTGGRSGLPIGTFYIGVAGPDGLEVAERIHTDTGDRDGNKRQAAQAVIDLLGSNSPGTRACWRLPSLVH